MNLTRQTPLSIVFSRQEYWSGLPFHSPGCLLDPEMETMSLASAALQVDSLPLCHLWSPVNWDLDVKWHVGNQFSSIQSLSHVWLFAAPWTAAWQASLPSSTTSAYSNSRPLDLWCHPVISSSVIPFSSRIQSFPASGSFQMSQFFESGGQSIGVSASASVLPTGMCEIEIVKCNQSLYKFFFCLKLQNNSVFYIKINK